MVVADKKLLVAGPEGRFDEQDPWASLSLNSPAYSYSSENNALCGTWRTVDSTLISSNNSMPLEGNIGGYMEDTNLSLCADVTNGWYHIPE